MILTVFFLREDQVLDGLARELRELALEVADAGLARVAPDDRLQRLVVERELLRLQPVLLQDLRASGGAWRSRPSRPRCSRRCG